MNDHDSEPTAPRGDYPLKRPLDLLLGAAAAVALMPPGLLTALGVRIFLGAPVLFRQMRPGLGGRPFTMVKFRSMKAAASNAREGVATDAIRLTPFGRLIRSLSLDELPTLLSVLKGDMSLVGPRPLLMKYLALYSPEQARRHDVRPGITGWAQVNGRNAISWEEKFGLDLYYVDNRSLALDLKILLMTVAKVLGRSDISNEGHATTPEFLGNDDSGSARTDDRVPT